MDETVYDIAIIGAGPCGLAVAARMREPAASALFTDHEHARYWRRYQNQTTVEKEAKRSRHLRTGDKDCPRHAPSMIVLDADSDQWMSSWRSKFQKLAITHLRSPLFFHPDPSDRDGLLAFVHAEERMDEVCEIPNVVGRELSKHRQKKARKIRNVRSASIPNHLSLDNRDRNDYYTPSSYLFQSYINSILQRYDLCHLVKRARVTSVDYNFVSTSTSKLFALATSTNETIFARTLVLATGPSTSSSRIPSPYCQLTSLVSNNCVSHVLDPDCPLTAARFENAVLETRNPQFVIIGGGLTSAQVTNLLLTRYQKSNLTIHLIIRSKLKVKHFDVDLHWVAKLRNHEMAAFWSADSDEERFEMLKAAKGGGSITPAYAKTLDQWVQKGRLVMHQGYEIDCRNMESGRNPYSQGDNVTSTSTRTMWNCSTQSWTVLLKRSLFAPKSSTASASQFPSEKTIENVRHILFATSSPPDIHQLPLLACLKEQYPIEDIQGLPVLTQDLMWRDDMPLFVTGALAGLRLGPGAGNLGGSRIGAERIAWKLEEILIPPQNGGCGSNGGSDNETDTGVTPSSDNSARCSTDGLLPEKTSSSGSSLASRSSSVARSRFSSVDNATSESDTDVSLASGVDINGAPLSTASKLPLFDEYIAGSGNQFASLALLNNQ